MYFIAKLEYGLIITGQDGTYLTLIVFAVGILASSKIKDIATVIRGMNESCK